MRAERAIAMLLILGGVCSACSTTAVAQEAGKVPIQQDLRRSDKLEDRIEQRIEERTGRPAEGAGTPGSVARPRVQSDPSGVAGFNGPPGTVGDSVGSYSPLPPGAPGNDQ